MSRQFSFLAALCITLIAGATAQVVDEYQVKAAFLYNFVKFVEWPQRTFNRDADPIHICVIGDTPLERVLQENIGGKAIEGRPLVIRKISGIREANTCQILFVGGSEPNYGRSILDALNTTGVLTVGERDGFAAQGGVINFKLDNGRVRFEINVAAATQQQLRISSKLLSLALIVTN